MKQLSVSIVVPALNEEGTVAGAIYAVTKACKLTHADFEIIVFDDGSTDKTGQIADICAKHNKRVSVIHNKKTQGLGGVFRQFIQIASKQYWSYFPGDADMASWSLAELIKQAGQADLVMMYPRNTSARSLFRQVISRAFVTFMNLLLGINIRYYTGSFITKVQPVKKLSLIANGFGSLFEFKVRMILQGASYKEIQFDHVGRISGASKAFTLGNFIDTACVILFLFRVKWFA